MRSLAEHSSSVRVLNLDCIYITDGVLLSLANNMPNLATISFSLHWDNVQRDPTIQAIEQLAVGCPELREMTIWYMAEYQTGCGRNLEDLKQRLESSYESLRVELWGW